MSENITGGILSAETESMTFSAFGVRGRCTLLLVHFQIPELKERDSFSLYHASGIKAGIFSATIKCSIYLKRFLIIGCVILNSSNAVVLK